ncbi:MAG: CoA transferase [Acidimicrobiaceae bacterium]|nr:CoA transferase [Acidimicrobiaceae bacterium]
MAEDLGALNELVLELDRPPPDMDPSRALERWAGSGAMVLTGRADRPPRVVPVSLVSGLDLLADWLTDLGGPKVDGPALLGERAAVSAMRPRGTTSLGGDAHLVDAEDGTVCLNLARPEDLASIPALLGTDLDPTDWLAVRRAITRRRREDLTEVADLLGIPLGVPGTAADKPALVRQGGSRPGAEDPILVVEFGSLWAAPLCGGLLRQAGCRVVKVESSRRPDGARSGSAAFFDLLNAGKESVVIDPMVDAEMALVRRLVDRADVVLEASRPRALRHWGLDADEAVDRGTVWVSITGYGRTGQRSGGVAFGDDAAVSGGLLLDDPREFVADAVADPSTGLLAAAMVLGALSDARGSLIDLSLAGTSQWLRSGSGRMAEPNENTLMVSPRIRTQGTGEPSS